MAIELYEHNKVAYDAVISMLAKTGKAAVIHPTGTGKSFIGFKLCEDNPGKTVLWLTPSEYIFRTQLENLKTACKAVSIPQNVRFLTYAKLMNMSDEELRKMAPVPDIIVLDEFHRSGAPKWQRGVRRFLNVFSRVPVLGLTATAIRYLDNRRDMSLELFDGNIASEMTLGEAIVRGILNPPKYVLSAFAYQKDLKKYERRVRNSKNGAVRGAAERYLEALRRALDKADGLDEIFARHMTERTGKYIVFCADKKHMDEMIEKAGEWFAKVDKHPRIYSVYSAEPGAEQSFADFKADNDDTHLRLLYCIDALNEGIHVNGVSGVILLRPTVSPIVYKQQIGRALSAATVRTNDDTLLNVNPSGVGGAGRKPSAVIFDVVMNIENLYSIDAVEEEMRVAMTYYRSLGEDDSIVNHEFKVIDELRDSKELFRKLDDLLSTSWETMYGYAKQYYMKYGELNIPRRYKTADGYSLGQWIHTQRAVRRGEVYGILTDEQVSKLNDIGMIWESVRDAAWERYYAEAQKYFDKFGDLRVPTPYITPSGVLLGNWIASLRTYRRSGLKSGYLTSDRIRALDEIGMVWNVPDYLWERNYSAAMRYHRKHGDIDVPVSYVDSEGVRLGTWLANMRQAAKRGSCRLTKEQMDKLTDLGFNWGGKYAAKWEEGYKAAKAYYVEHANLNVPTAYVTETGYRLGGWIRDQRECYLKGELAAERRKRLEEIGMDWRRANETQWERRYAAVREYFDRNGSINIPKAEILSDGKDGRSARAWLFKQYGYYREGKLTGTQIEKLRMIGIEFDDKLNKGGRIA